MMELAAYDPAWTELFDEEGVAVLETIEAPVAGIEHVGSTAVRGLPARPIVDMALGVGDLEMGAKLVVPLQRAGYEYRGQASRAGQLDFCKRVDVAADLYVVEHGGEVWSRHLEIRESLRSDEEERGQFADIKRSVAHESGVDSEAYAEAKAAAFDAIRTLG